jgi:ribosome-associated toxin RatA of RatAB toxin-antitoxin module
MTSIQVKAPPRKVREYIWNAHNLPNYMPVSDMQVLEAAERHAKLSYALAAGGKQIALTCIREMDEQGRKIKTHSVEGMPMDETWVLQDLKDGTQITHIIDYEPQGGLVDKLFSQGRVRKDMYNLCCAGLEKLRALLEAQAA